MCPYRSVANNQKLLINRPELWTTGWGARNGACLLSGRRQTLISRGVRCIGRIQRHELAHHAIGPAEAVLVRIFAAAALSSGGDDIIFLDQFPALAVYAIDTEHPSAGNGLRQGHQGVLTQTPDP